MREAEEEEEEDTTGSSSEEVFIILVLVDQHHHVQEVEEHPHHNNLPLPVDEAAIAANEAIENNQEQEMVLFFSFLILHSDFCNFVGRHLGHLGHLGRGWSGDQERSQVQGCSGCGTQVREIAPWSSSSCWLTLTGTT